MFFSVNTTAAKQMEDVAVVVDEEEDKNENEEEEVEVDVDKFRDKSMAYKRLQEKIVGAPET